MEFTKKIVKIAIVDRLLSDPDRNTSYKMSKLAWVRHRLDFFPRLASTYKKRQPSSVLARIMVNLSELEPLH